MRIKKHTFIINFIFLFICSIQVSSQIKSNISKSEEENKVQKLSLIDPTYANKVKATISPWLKYYEIDINKFRLIDSRPNTIFEDSTSLYFRYFDLEDDVYLPNYHDYSLDRNQYIALMEAVLVTLEEDGRLTYMGSDDCQGIYLIDRKNKKKTMVSFRGISSIAEAAFWLNNNVFMLVDYNNEKFSIEIFDIRNERVSLYQLNQHSDKDSYLIEINMKGRNVIFE